MSRHVTTLLLWTMCTAHADDSIVRNLGYVLGKQGINHVDDANVLREELSKAQTMEDKAVKEEGQAVTDEKRAEVDLKIAEGEENIAEKHEELTEFEERLVEKHERKVAREGEAGHLKAAAADAKALEQEERAVEKDEKAAENEERMAEADEQTSLSELSNAKKEEVIAEKDEQAAEKEEQVADKSGVDDHALLKLLQGEKGVMKEEVQTRQRFWQADVAQKAERNAEQAEAQAEMEEVKVENQEDQAEKDDRAGLFQQADKDEARAESGEKGVQQDEMIAAKKEQMVYELTGKKVMQSPQNIVTKLYDRERIAIPEASTWFTRSSGIFAAGLTTVLGFTMLALRTVQPNSNRRRERDFIPLDDGCDGYDSEAPAE